MVLSLYCGVMVLDSGMSDDKAQCLHYSRDCLGYPLGVFLSPKVLVASD